MKTESIKENKFEPLEFEFCIGGCFAPTLTVRLIDGRLLCEKSQGLYSTAPAKEIKQDDNKWLKFFNEINDIGVWDWQRYYDGHGHDGTHWFIRIKLADREITSEGESLFPGSDMLIESAQFRQLLKAIGELIGEEEIW